MSRSWAIGLILGVVAIARADDLSEAERKKLEAEAKRLNREAVRLYDERKLVEAYRLAKEALAMRQKLYPADKYKDGHADLALSLNNLGSVLKAMAEYGKAREYYEQALMTSAVGGGERPLSFTLQDISRLKLQPDTLRFLANRAWLLERVLPRSPSDDQLRECLRSHDLSTALQERFRSEVLQSNESKLIHGEEADALTVSRLGLAGRLFDLTQDKADLRDAFTALERSRARVFLESFGKANAGRLSNLPDKVTDREVRLNATLRRLDAEMAALDGKPGDDASRSRRAKFDERLKVEDELRAFARDLAGVHPQYAALRFPQPCSLDEARKCLADDEVALLFATGKEASYCLLVEPKPDPTDKGDGLAIYKLPGREAIWEKVQSLVSGRLETARGARVVGAKLHDMLLKPLGDRIIGKNLVVVADGPLCFLPFELLADADGKFLLETRRVRYAPSLTALHMIGRWEDGRAERPSSPVWALGDPVFQASDDRLKDRKVDVAMASKDALADYVLRSGKRAGYDKRLPFSGDEVRAVAKELRAPKDAVVTDLQASEAVVKTASDRGDLLRARYVHFATHGILGVARGKPPSLVLSLVGNDEKEQLGGVNDGFLRLDEVTHLRLNADLVVLSACETAKGQLRDGEGIGSLARAFFYAGCRSVVCSLWSVDDAATSELMTAMYRELEKQPEGKRSAAEALRTAKLELMRAGHPPLHWAPFILLGR